MMSEKSEATESAGTDNVQQLSLQELVERLALTKEELNRPIRYNDTLELGGCFDDIEHYLDMLELSAEQQTCIKETFTQHGTQVVMNRALKLWCEANPHSSTFEMLIVKLLNQRRGDVAVKVCSTMRKLGDFRSALSSEPTLEEFIALRVDKVWYQLGFWLGVDMKRLQNTWKYLTEESKAESMFREYLETGLGPNFIDFLNLFQKEKREMVYKFFHESYPYKEKNYDKMIKELSDSEKETAEVLFHRVKGQTEKLVLALCRVGLNEAAGKVCQAKGVSLTKFLEDKDPASIQPDCVRRYASYLKTEYKNLPNLSDDWPSTIVENGSYTNLALIKTDSTNKSSSMEHDYIHGNIDNVVAAKEPIELDEVFFPIINSDTNESRLTILMDGAPGVGKTTIARKLCIEWAKGEMLQEYHLVILIQLREGKLNEPCNVEDLFPSDLKTLQKEVTQFYLDPQNLGKRVLIIFDGYDEADESCLIETSLLLRLIKGKVLQNCSILITSRPYASDYLRTLSRINRHIEVLGFTSKQIEECMRSNLDNKEAAEKLIKLLDQRLDITSLCYIPLNCRIVSFVYKMKGFELPATLTELYEIFLLHTIKHHLRKNEKNSEKIAAIDGIECLSDLPCSSCSYLDTLCQIAYNGIKHSKYFLKEKQMQAQSENPLSLGLLTAHHSITVTHVEKLYQFLHLTVQEFLAAKYLATIPQEELLTLVREHINDVKFRMMLLFTAGLTKLQFVPSGQILLEDDIELTRITPKQIRAQSSLPFLWEEYSEPSNHEPVYYDKKLFVLLAHMFYESQVPSSTQLANVRSGKLDRSGELLSRFEALVIFHFLSHTPKDVALEVINLVEYNLIPCVFQHSHQQNYDRLLIGNLNVKPFDAKPLLPLITQNLHEIHFYFAKFDHKTLCALFGSIVCGNQKLLITFVDGPFSLATAEISRNQVNIPYTLFPMCSNSFINVLKFLEDGDSESILCPNQSKIFTNCTQCESNGQEAFESLCLKLCRSANVSNVDLSACGLSSSMINLIISAISFCTLKELNIDGNNDATLDNVLCMITKGISIKACGFSFQPKGKELFVSDLSSSIEQQIFLLGTFHVPDSFTTIRFEMNASDLYIISIDCLARFLLENQNLQCFHLYPYTKYWSNSFKETVVLTQAISTHKNLESFSSPQITLSRDSLRLSGEKKDNIKFLEICPNALLTLLDFLTKDVQTLAIKDLPKAFQNCGKCEVPANKTVQKLYKMISESNKLTYLTISNCKLSEETTAFLASSAPTSLHSVDLTGNKVSASTINKLITLFEFHLFKLRIDGFVVQSDERTKLHIECSADKVSQCYIHTLLLPSQLKLVQLSISNEQELQLAPVIISLLKNNAHIREIMLPKMILPKECHEVLSVSEYIICHKSLQRLKIHSGKTIFEVIIIAKEKMLLEGLKVCPMSLQKLLLFVDYEQLEHIDLSCQYAAFQNCSDCGAPNDEVFSTFLDVLNSSKNLKSLNITNCHLSASKMEKVAKCLTGKSLALSVLIENNVINIQIFNHLLSLFSNIIFQKLRLTDTVVYTINNQDSVIYLEYYSRTYNPEHLFAFLERVCSIPLNHSGVKICKAVLTCEFAAPMKELVCEHKTVKSLTLNQCTLPSDFVDVFIKSIKTTLTLKELVLCYVTFIDCSVIKLIRALGYSRLEKLYFHLTYEDKVSSQELGESLSELIQSTMHLQELSLSHYDIDLTVLQSIVKGLLANTTLQVLQLFNSPGFRMLKNKESKEIGKQFKLILAHPNLKILNLTHHYFDEEVMNHFASGLSANTSLQELVLDSLQLPHSLSLNSWNYDECLTSPMWITLFEALKHNSSLHTLSIGRNDIGREGIAALKDLLDVNKSITKLKGCSRIANSKKDKDELASKLRLIFD